MNVHAVQHIFAKHRILVFQEEGDISHINQAYNQFAAKADKLGMHQYCDIVKPILWKAMDQWYLMDIAIGAQKNTKEAWINSLKRMNIHP